MIVQDKLDPSGMFSKAGRLSLEMYTMLQEKELILDGKRKDYSSYDLEGQQEKLSLAQHDRHRSFLPRKGNENYRSQPLLQPFQKITSREYCLELQQKLVNNNQKFGMYSPKFHMVYEKSSLYPDLENEENKQRAREFQQKNIHFTHKKGKSKKSQLLDKSPPPESVKQNKSQLGSILNDVNASQLHRNHSLPPNQQHSHIASMNQSQQQGNNNDATLQSSGGLAAIDKLSQSLVVGNNPNTSASGIQAHTTRNRDTSTLSQGSLLGIDFDKPQRKLVGPILMNLQTNRKPLLNDAQPHEKRFEFLEIPQNSTKSVRLPKLKFEHQKREDSVFGAKTGGLDYNINYSQVLPRNDQGVLNYSKLTERKFPEKPVYSLNEQIAEEDYYNSKSQLFKKVPAPRFNKMGGREEKNSGTKMEEIDIDSHVKSTMKP